jgi:Protein of unknown function (DUF3465)
MKRFTLVAAVVAGGLVFVSCGGAPSRDSGTAGAGDEALARAFDEHAVDLEVQGSGTVARILSDDNEGGRHQRFILRLASGQTLLIVHNIDIAPRVDGLRVGDTVAFRGEYEWNEQGGTVHWTHHDPDGEHAPGWLRHRGRTYQ